MHTGLARNGQTRCNGNAKSRSEPVIEQLVGRQGQPRGAQVPAMWLSEDRKGQSQDTPIPRPHLSVGRGGEGLSCWRILSIWGLLKVSSSFISFLLTLYLDLLVCCS